MRERERGVACLPLSGVGTYWAGLDGRLEDQARVLGAARWRTFVEVTLPRLRPAITAAASIVFLFAFTSFGIVLILGGPRRATIETEIYRQAIVRSDLSTAAAVAVVQLVCVLALVVVSTRLERRKGPARTSPRAQSGAVSTAMLVGNIGTMVILLGLPIAVLVERSLAVGSGYSLRHYGALVHRVPQLPGVRADRAGELVALRDGGDRVAVVLGCLGALVVVHGRGALRHAFDLGLTLPLGISAVTIGFGMLLALDQPPLDLRTSRWIIPIAHALIGIPFVVRTMVPVLRGIDDRLRDAATVLGASPVARAARGRRPDRGPGPGRRGRASPSPSRSASSVPPPSSPAGSRRSPHRSRSSGCCPPPAPSCEAKPWPWRWC